MITSKDLMFTGSQNKEIKVWDLKKRCYVKKLVGHQDFVNCLLVHNGLLYSGSSDGTIRMWDLDTEQCLATINAHEGKPVTSLAIVNDKLVSGCEDGTLKMWGQASQ